MILGIDNRTVMTETSIIPSPLPLVISVTRVLCQQLRRLGSTDQAEKIPTTTAK
jgi:hypothetical protein